MPDLKISALPSVVVPSSSDVLPIVNAGATKKVAVSDLLATASGLTLPYIRMSVDNVAARNLYNLSGGGCNNNTTYHVCFDSKNEPFSSSLEGDLVNKNIIIKATGTYLISARVGFFDLLTGNSTSTPRTGRIRLYSNSSTMTPAAGGIFNLSGPTLVSTMSLNYPATDPASGFISGEAVFSGSYILRVTSAPIYVAIAVHVTAGSGNSNSAAFIVTDNTYGNQPEIIVQKLTNI